MNNWTTETLMDRIKQGKAKIAKDSPMKLTYLIQENGVNVVNVAKKKKRGRHRKLNKTELEALPIIQARYPKNFIIVQGSRLDFPDGETFYEPDFVLIPPKCQNLDPIVIEIKGDHVGKVAWSRHGIERYRRAREAFGVFFNFELWTKKKEGWIYE